MATHDVKADPMAGRIARWGDIQRNGVPVMFIDSVLPGHYRMNYAVIGDTASENPDYEPAISDAAQVPDRDVRGAARQRPGLAHAHLRRAVRAAHGHVEVHLRRRRRTTRTTT